MKKKYWYRTDIDTCVLCGKEIRNKYRVYVENEKGLHVRENACWEHF